MSFEFWAAAAAGLLLVSFALIGSFFRRLPLTTTMCYFAVGIAVGPLGFDLIRIDPVDQAGLLERLAELAVIVSLFTTGLKLHVPIAAKVWSPPLRLAFISMVLTVGMVALALVLVLDVHWGAAVLIGAVLAPTDPVLASDVQVRRPGDDDRLRFSLTAEAGLNDGTAFPFVMLGLGLLGLHDLGESGWRWWTIDVAWAIVAGLGIGTLLGLGTGECVLYLRCKHKEGFGYDEFLTLGLIGLSYGLALIMHAYGFLAVFAAGVALRSVERRHPEGEKSSRAGVGREARAEHETAAGDHRPKELAVHMTDSVLAFNEQIERLIEVALVLCLGVMLAPQDSPRAVWWFIPLLVLVIRPAAVLLGLIGSSTTRRERALISWLGIRGIGSVYYLMYAVGLGLSEQFTRELVSLVVVTVAVSIFLHGLTASPLMRMSGARRGPERGPRS